MLALRLHRCMRFELDPIIWLCKRLGAEGKAPRLPDRTRFAASEIADPRLPYKPGHVRLVAHCQTVGKHPRDESESPLWWDAGEARRDTSTSSTLSIRGLFARKGLFDQRNPPNEPCASGEHPRPTRQGLSGTGGWPPIQGRWAIEVGRVKNANAPPVSLRTSSGCHTGIERKATMGEWDHRIDCMKRRISSVGRAAVL